MKSLHGASTPSRHAGLALLRLLALIVLAGVAFWLVCLLTVLGFAHRDGAREAEAIVVLGAAQYQGTPSPVLKARLDHGLTLWRRGMAKKFVLTGGSMEGDTWSEASAGRRYVMRRGVPDSAILLESRGRSSLESLEAVAQLMEGSPTRSVILVSDPFHMFRLWVLARRNGLVPYTSPTRTSPIAVNRDLTWRYYLGESLKAPLAFFQR